MIIKVISLLMLLKEWRILKYLIVCKSQMGRSVIQEIRLLSIIKLLIWKAKNLKIHNSQEKESLMFFKWETIQSQSAGNLQLIHYTREIELKLNVLLIWAMEEMKNGVNFQMKKFQLSVISFSKYKYSLVKNRLRISIRKIKNKVMEQDKLNQFHFKNHFYQKKRLNLLHSKKY